MKVKSARLMLAAFVTVLTLALATSTYAKLVVLSFPFNSNTEGFTVSVEGADSGCNPSISTSWSNGSMLIAVGATDSCRDQSIIIDKLVVLSSSIQNPTVGVRVKDTDGILVLADSDTAISNLNDTAIAFGAADANGWHSGTGNWAATAASGQQHITISIPLGEGGWSNTKYVSVDDVEIASN